MWVHGDSSWYQLDQFVTLMLTGSDDNWDVLGVTNTMIPASGIESNDMHIKSFTSQTDGQAWLDSVLNASGKVGN